jgi:hypothetical protein
LNNLESKGFIELLVRKIKEGQRKWIWKSANGKKVVVYLLIFLVILLFLTH